MFTIELLPAQQGDCVWIEYGTPGSVHRILIDGGTPPTYEGALRAKIESLPESSRNIDLLVVTHVDTDHIGGVLKLLDDADIGIEPDDTWFNVWPQIAEDDRLGAVDGEILSCQLTRRGWAWNGARGGAAVCVPPVGPLPTVTIPGGMAVTVLTPGHDALSDLRRHWAKVCADAELVPGVPSPELARRAAQKGVSLADERLGDTELDVPRLAEAAFEDDESVANRSTISLMLEFEGVRCLLPGDASSGCLIDGLERLGAVDGERVRIDALKLPHHGSKHNVSRPLLDHVRCRHFLCSTNGNIFRHPDREAIARVVRYGGPQPTIYFNYSSDWTLPWGDPKRQRKHRYRAAFGQEPGRIRLDLQGLG